MASTPQMAPAPSCNVAVKPGFFISTGKSNVVLSLLLILLTLIVYNPIIRNDFLQLDDPAYITANPHVRAGLTWPTIKWAFTSTEQANWHPVTWLSHALDFQIYGLRAAGHHYVTVLLHAATAVLLFLFLCSATGFAGRSALVAALFAIHPMNVQSVAWASERKNVLCMFFFALMLLAYRAYSQNPEWKRYSVVAILFALGLMSKPMLVTAPLLLLLLDYWPLNRFAFSSARTLIIEKLPFLAMSLASCVVTLVAQNAGGAIHHQDFPLSGRMANAFVAYARYLGKAIWPSRLAAFYPYSDHPGWQVALCLGFVAAITTVVAVNRERRYLTVGWLWFLGSMVPMIGLVQVGEQAMADRYAYLPFLGVFIALVWIGAEFIGSNKVAAGIVAAAACGALAVVAHSQIGYWKNTKTLWTHTLAVTGPNFVAEDSLGAELIDEGRLSDAVSHFQAAVRINPRDAFSRLDLGVCFKRMGNISGAVENYQAALQLSSDRNLRATAFGNLGSIYRVAGDYGRARADFEAALQLLPDYSLALTGMGLVMQKTGDTAGSLEYYKRAAAASPTDVAFLLWSQASAKADRQPDAQAALARAQALSQNWNATVGIVNHLLQE